MSDLRLSPKYGVNPAIPVCFLCNKDKNEIILAGRLKGDVEAPRGAVWNLEPCDECEGYMAQGIICISVREEEKTENPYRTGGWAVVREEAVQRWVSEPAILANILRQRVMFVPDTAWDLIGLPRGNPEPTEDAPNAE